MDGREGGEGREGERVGGWGELGWAKADGVGDGVGWDGEGERGKGWGMGGSGWRENGRGGLYEGYSRRVPVDRLNGILSGQSGTYSIQIENGPNSTSIVARQIRQIR